MVKFIKRMEKILKEVRSCVTGKDGKSGFSEKKKKNTERSHGGDCEYREGLGPRDSS